MRGEISFFKHLKLYLNMIKTVISFTSPHTRFPQP